MPSQENKKILDVVLLIALPASGKSEVRKYLEFMPIEKRIADFHMGETVQFDDFPYVHLMRCIDQELIALGQEKLFYHSIEKPYMDLRDWGVLIELLNEDYDDIVNKKKLSPKSVVEYYLDRIENASLKHGIPKRISKLSQDIRDTLKVKLEGECKKMFADKQKLLATDLKGKTIVIEFARGGSQGASMPLTGGYGYEYSLAKLSKDILDKAVLLYIWVTPEESRRKNQDRADPNDPGSILHHGVPLEVMLKDYGCDDIEWLEKHSEVPGTITVTVAGHKYHLPIAKFDNRQDKTSFLRGDPQKWDQSAVKILHSELKGALDKLIKAK